MTQCSYCHEPIFWRRMFKTGRRNPLDLQPSERGNVYVPEEPADLRMIDELLDRDVSELKVGEAIALNARDAGRLRELGEDLHLSHWVTCPKADEVRRDRQAGRT